MKSDFNSDGARRGEGLDRAAGSMPLADLAPGTRALVVEVRHTGPIGRRLQDLGLLPGTPVTAIRRAPLGDPSVYELRGYRLCLRREDAALVFVSTAEHAPVQASE
jgi:ferrous iron transport protein A